jgi:hypothetical protein
MEEIIGLLFHARNITHIEHLRTKSYAQHKALGSFYDNVIDLADNLAEAYQGEKGLLGEIPLYDTPPMGDIASFLEAQVKMIERMRTKINCCTAIQNIIDEIVALYLSTIYKLRNLS